MGCSRQTQWRDPAIILEPISGLRQGFSQKQLTRSLTNTQNPQPDRRIDYALLPRGRSSQSSGTSQESSPQRPLMMAHQLLRVDLSSPDLNRPVPNPCIATLNQGIKRGRRTLKAALSQTNELAAAGQLPDAELSGSGLKITPLENSVPKEGEALRNALCRLMPHVKITDLLMEVDRWTGFSRHFTHLKTNDPVKEPALLLTALLADATNLGLGKMAESCPGTSLARLSWLVAWHVRDETYSKALAEIVNYQHKLPFAAHWGEGNTSSSDGQRFRAGGRGEASGQVNPKYGNDPGVTFYTHISDQYAPFHTKVINAAVRDATHVLDGLLYHESDLRIEEHYTDTAGFTDHVFGLCQLLGFRFAPRIRDLADKRLYVPGKGAEWPALSPLIGGSINIRLIEQQLDEVLRLAASIQQGTVTASLILRKLGAYPRQNSLALALREIGRMERTLYTLAWLEDPALRRRVTAGLNKGEAKTHSPVPYSSTASARSETAHLKISGIGPADSTW